MKKTIIKKLLILMPILTLLISCANAQSQTYSHGESAHVDGSIENSFSEHQAIEELGISQEDFYGTWLWEGDGEEFIVMGLGERIYSDRTENSADVKEIISWDIVSNNESTYNEFPYGFKITLQSFLNIDDIDIMTIYINTNHNALLLDQRIFFRDN